MMVVVVADKCSAFSASFNQTFMMMAAFNVHVVLFCLSLILMVDLTLLFDGHVSPFTFHLGFVHPLQDVALHQCLPLSSVCCFPVSPFT